jgi:hypothetical protein
MKESMPLMMLRCLGRFPLQWRRQGIYIYKDTHTLSFQIQSLQILRVQTQTLVLAVTMIETLSVTKKRFF